MVYFELGNFLLEIFVKSSTGIKFPSFPYLFFFNLCFENTKNAGFVMLYAAGGFGLTISSLVILRQFKLHNVSNLSQLVKSKVLESDFVQKNENGLQLF